MRVEALHFQGLLAEVLEGIGKLADLVPANFRHGRLEVASGHVAHAVGQAGEAPHDSVAHPEPGGKGGGHDADDADDGQQHPALVEGLDGQVQRFGGVGAGPVEESRDGCLQGGPGSIEGRCQLTALVGEGKLLTPDQEDALAAAHLDDGLFEAALHQGGELFPHAVDSGIVLGAQHLA